MSEVQIPLAHAYRCKAAPGSAKQHPAAAVAVLLLAFAITPLPVLAFAEPLDDVYAAPRQQFKQAYAAERRGEHDTAARLIRGLENYPLYIYYRYARLSPRLHKAKSADVREFLSAYDGSLLAEKLRRAWLKHLLKRQRWEDFVQDYRPQDDVALQCAALRARLEIGAAEGVIAQTRRLWLVGKSQPGGCDRAFSYLKKSGQLDDEMIWQRIRLSLANKQTGLARYLAREFTDDSRRAAAEIWIAVHNDPIGGLKNPFFEQDTAITREIVVHAVARAAKSNVESGQALWQRSVDRYSFSPDESGRALLALAIAAARQNHPDRITYLDAVPRAHATDTLEKYRIREGIKTRSWDPLARWTELAPVGDISALRWRYWHARALEEIGHNETAKLAFRELAKQRDYYGFLSADKLGLEYQMNERTINPTPNEAAAIAERPGIVRARELFLIEKPYAARREWAFEVDNLSPRELEVAARLVHRWGWHDRAILALGRARSYDDLAIRFPVLHEALIREYAKKRELPVSVIYAIIRTESAFMGDARSPAGALGLMQVMPATGRETARRIGTQLSKARELLDPAKNIMIGSAYLKRVLDRFGGSFSLAAASYNAGPHRVRSWMPAVDCVPADIWIDTIPFTETRRYVRRAAFYATVYQWKLNESIDRLHERLTAVGPKGMQTQC